MIRSIPNIVVLSLISVKVEVLEQALVAHSGIAATTTTTGRIVRTLAVWAAIAKLAD